MKLHSIAMLCAISALTTACGQQTQSLPESARNPQVIPAEESQAAFERRCAAGNINRIPGLLRANRQVCLIQTGEFVENDYTVSNIIEDQDQVLMAAQAGSIIFGTYEGGPDGNGPEVVVNSTIIGKGNIPVTRVPANGYLHLFIYGGFYKKLSYFAGFCFGRNNNRQECPIPLNP